MRVETAGPPELNPQRSCRFCGTPLNQQFVDLGMSPLSNSYLESHQLQSREPFYPLQVFVCHHCFLVQLPEFESPELLFQEYAYFSSYSDIWLKHARDYTDFIVDYLKLDQGSFVLEIASNDGYLLQYLKQRGIPVLGIEPAANVAQVAQAKGIPTLVEFFGARLGRQLAERGQKADLIIGNNILAHVPALNDFVAGLQAALKPRGIITMEFPHLLCLMRENQFDTIYHEHFSYFSLTTVAKVFAAQGLTIYDVEELPTHGGSLRIFACHEDNGLRSMGERLLELQKREEDFGINRLETYRAFGEQVKATKREILAFLIQAKEAGKSIVGYGAPAKGNTLLNYCGIRTDFLDYTVDRSPYKQGRFLPGTHIPIDKPEKVRATRPDYLFILPWNIKDEIMSQMACIRDWGGKFVVPIPQVTVYD
jgi:SAM-dependent methyltransferase